MNQTVGAGNAGVDFLTPVSYSGLYSQGLLTSTGSPDTSRRGSARAAQPRAADQHATPTGATSSRASSGDRLDGDRRADRPAGQPAGRLGGQHPWPAARDPARPGAGPGLVPTSTVTASGSQGIAAATTTIDTAPGLIDAASLYRSRLTNLRDRYNARADQIVNRYLSASQDAGRPAIRRPSSGRQPGQRPGRPVERPGRQPGRCADRPRRGHGGAVDGRLTCRLGIAGPPDPSGRPVRSRPRDTMGGSGGLFRPCGPRRLAERDGMAREAIRFDGIEAVVLDAVGTLIDPSPLSRRGLCRRG